ncbi:Equilibrative nucleoside transporter 1 [Armadillidium nasatum]|uniref:Equilibrative nucleoside transporter 1 n=1 Tax=Armadillidium nasatum TaxID=96803 RepID=A0A5N5TDW1_9CRUS|nr:Equilibrative nucleoside transporter 1 [Armadillidium nasatum]
MQVCLSQIVNFSFLFINALSLVICFSQKLRLLSSLLFMLFLFVVTTVFVRVDTDYWQLGFFIFTMFIIVLISASGATFQGGLFGVASTFPQRFINAVGVGQALGGVFASVTRIISVYMGVDDVTSALIYFLIAVVVMVLTLFVYLYVNKLTFFSHYSNPSSNRSEENSFSKTMSNPTLANLLKEHYKIFRLIWPYGTSMCLVFIVTLAVFPVLSVKINSASSNPVWARPVIVIKTLPCYIGSIIMFSFVFSGITDNQ